MTLLESLGAVFESGQRVRRRFWASSIYCLLDNEQLCIRGFDGSRPDDGLNHPWIITSEDYFATDWEVVV